MTQNKVISEISLVVCNAMIDYDEYPDQETMELENNFLEKTDNDSRKKYWEMHKERVSDHLSNLKKIKFDCKNDKSKLLEKFSQEKERIQLALEKIEFDDKYFILNS